MATNSAQQEYESLQRNQLERDTTALLTTLAQRDHVQMEKLNRMLEKQLEQTTAKLQTTMEDRLRAADKVMQSKIDEAVEQAKKDEAVKAEEEAEARWVEAIRAEMQEEVKERIEREKEEDIMVRHRKRELAALEKEVRLRELMMEDKEYELRLRENAVAEHVEDVIAENKGQAQVLEEKQKELHKHYTKIANEQKRLEGWEQEIKAKQTRMKQKEQEEADEYQKRILFIEKQESDMEDKEYELKKHQRDISAKFDALREQQEQLEEDRKAFEFEKSKFQAREMLFKTQIQQQQEELLKQFTQAKEAKQQVVESGNTQVAVAPPPVEDNQLAVAAAPPAVEAPMGLSAAPPAPGVGPQSLRSMGAKSTFSESEYQEFVEDMKKVVELIHGQEQAEMRERLWSAVQKWGLDHLDAQSPPATVTEAENEGLNGTVTSLSQVSLQEKSPSGSPSPSPSPSPTATQQPKQQTTRQPTMAKRQPTVIHSHRQIAEALEAAEAAASAAAEEAEAANLVASADKEEEERPEDKVEQVTQQEIDNDQAEIQDVGEPGRFPSPPTGLKIVEIGCNHVMLAWRPYRLATQNLAISSTQTDPMAARRESLSGSVTTTTNDPQLNYLVTLYQPGLKFCPVTPRETKYTSIKLVGLDPNTNYEAHVMSMSKFGRSERTTATFRTSQRMAGPPKPPSRTTAGPFDMGSQTDLTLLPPPPKWRTPSSSPPMPVPGSPMIAAHFPSAKLIPNRNEMLVSGESAHGKLLPLAPDGMDLVDLSGDRPKIRPSGGQLGGGSRSGTPLTPIGRFNTPIQVPTVTADSLLNAATKPKQLQPIQLQGHQTNKQKMLEEHRAKRAQEAAVAAAKPASKVEDEAILRDALA
eukprot:TRINITY_DN53734_c0_g1_i1.p1 TRINITY_DN53734_c0_g1~~TRINITY_DN53734_c0_g1_i1.p1  ORF type:complete len:867 (+),score=157.87 TRINITY_DN53734_c0_g1_i1:50-2650(+)